MKRSPMTTKGAERLRAEVERLKSVERPRIIAAIAEARAHGDLKENAEYHAAREQQGFVEGRIQELEAALSYAEVIDVARLNPNGKVVFGATVELLDESSNSEVTYQIVGDLEADIKQRLIAVNSPLARALIGKSEGDSFEFADGIVAFAWRSSARRKAGTRCRVARMLRIHRYIGADRGVDALSRCERCGGGVVAACRPRFCDGGCGDGTPDGLWRDRTHACRKR